MKDSISVVVLLVMLSCLLNATFGDQSYGAEKSKKSLKKGSISIEYTEDPSLCEKMVWKRELFGKTSWTLVTPIDAIEAALWSTRKSSSQRFGDIYSRGQFDFDNDGIRDVVYRISGGVSDSFFLMKSPQPPESKDMEDSFRKETDQWPQDFGIEWLERESDRSFSLMWRNCPSEKEGCGNIGKYSHDYQIKHHKGNKPLFLDFHYIGFTVFRHRDITYLLAFPTEFDEYGIRVLFRPGPKQTVNEVCVFKFVG